MMESCATAEASEAPAEPKKVRARRPRAKPEAKPETTIADPPPPPSIVVDAPFFAALGGALRRLRQDDRHAKLSSLRIA